MNLSSAIELATLILAAIQVWQGFRKTPERKEGAPEIQSGVHFTLSRKRLLLLTLTLVIFAIVWVWSAFLSHSQHKQIAEEQLTLVLDQQFVNETVSLDGKDFQHCKFVNATLRLEGKHNFSMKDNVFDGAIKLTFDSPAAIDASDLLVNLLLNGNMISNGKIGFVNKHDDVVLLPGPDPHQIKH